MAVEFLRGAAAWSGLNDMEKQRAMQAVQRGERLRLFPFSSVSRGTWILIAVLFTNGIAAFPLTFATEETETPVVIDGEYWLARFSEFHNRPIKYKQIAEEEYWWRKRTESRPFSAILMPVSFFVFVYFRHRRRNEKPQFAGPA